MTIAAHVRALHDRLSHLERCSDLAPHGTYDRGKEAAAAIAGASNGIRAAFERHGFACLGDDRLRSIEAAIYGLLLESNPDESGLIVAEGFGQHVGTIPGRDLIREAAEQRDALARLKAAPPY